MSTYDTGTDEGLVRREFTWGFVELAAIARKATANDVVIRVGPLLGEGHDVVKRAVSGAKEDAAVEA